MLVNIKKSSDITCYKYTALEGNFLLPQGKNYMQLLNVWFYWEVITDLPLHLALSLSSLNEY